jgi:hypothetical protein
MEKPETLARITTFLHHYQRKTKEPGISARLFQSIRMMYIIRCPWE